MKYFVMSDLHSFFDQTISALAAAGFNADDETHILIICGDVFDRGCQSVQLFDWLMSLPQHRIIPIKGNHELLYLELLDKDLPESHDFSNGTVRTFCNLAGVSDKMMNMHELLFDAQAAGKNVTPLEIQQQLKYNWKRIKSEVEKHPATAWIKGSSWCNFYELENFIFVHSFIPLELKPECQNGYYKYFPTYQFGEDMLQVVPEWRTKALCTQWDDAKWGCPWKLFNAGLFADEAKAGKRLVCGHWHASDFHKKFEGDTSNNLTIFFSDNLIALDACTAASGFCNVLVIDVDTKKCFDVDGNYLGDM